jgi:phosphinothricin acetyltransferase
VTEPAIRDAASTDAAAIAAIYNAYVRDTIVTFEVEDVTADAMAWRIADIRARGLPWLVAVEGGVVLGYAHAGP